ncbi:alpha/beta fold hydrolase [Mycolicibacterium komossense]|uniref:Alpha/beta hydrolase n=1 Tax=Mycolicibacterium komossense TaxID=1779 RepID=A0ABT3CGL5_9MYCO|nr:alpha/beta hydrolase [Mycolicibacterium komossense]MCV7228376.1 alpha/beta hydrolase [Mycolicibacterium komossense]
MTRDRSPVLRRQFRLPIESGWLHVNEWGSRDADVTVVLTHGWSLSSRSWEDVAELLVTTDPALRVVAYDHRGHGSSSIAPASIDILADDLAALLRAHVPDGPIVFGGHSLGGMTLMALAQHYPAVIEERVFGAAFVATSAGDLLGAIRKVRGVDLLLRAGLVVSSRLRVPSRPLILARQGTRGALFGTRPRRRDMNRSIQQVAQANPRAVASLGRSLLRHNRYEALAKFSDVDVVVMAGTKDWLTSPAHARRIAQLIPNSQVVVYEGAGHHLPYERREAVAAQLLALTTKARASAWQLEGSAG